MLFQNLLLKAAANAAALWVAAHYIGGVSIAPWVPPGLDALGVPLELWSLVVGGAALAVLNAVLKPVEKLLGAALPIITFPMLAVAVNALALYLGDLYLSELAIEGVRPLLFTSLLLGVVNVLL